MSTRRRVGLLIRVAGAWVILGPSLGGCRRAPPAPDKPLGTPMRIEAVPNAPISGTVRGQPFATRNARYYVDRRAGYEHLDIQFNDGESSDPCGPLNPPDATRVWLRWTGGAFPDGGEIRLEASSKSGWSAHYQTRRDSAWIGSGDATGALLLRRAGLDRAIRGSLSTCFDDRHGSCVAGTFVARECPLELDMPVRGSNANTEKGAP